jgi:hypothetical protein
MAYQRRFFSGFCGYNTAALMAEEWTSVGTVAAFPIGNNSIGFSCQNPQNCVVSSSDTDLALQQVAGWQVTMSLSFAASGGIAQEFLRLEDLIPNTCVQFFRQPSKFIRVNCPSGFGAVTDNATQIQDNTYTAIDIGYFQSATSGRLEVRVNGTRIAALTSNAYSGGLLASTNMSSFVPASLRLVNGGGGGPITYDYIGVLQDTAAWADTPTQVWPGVLLKGVQRPSGNGTYATGTQWLPSGALTYWEATHEAINDHDFTYNVYNGIPSSVPSDRISVALQSTAANLSVVRWVCQKSSLRMSPAGSTAAVKLFLDNSSVPGGALQDQAAPTSLDTGAAYKYIQQNYDFANGATAWTPALINGSQIGVLATALS